MPLSENKSRHKTNLGYTPRPPLSALTLCGRCRHTGDIGYVVASSELAIGGKSLSGRTKAGFYVSPVDPDRHIGKTALKILATNSGTAKSALSEAAQGDPKKRNRQAIVITDDGQAEIFTGRSHLSQTDHFSDRDFAAARVGTTDIPVSATDIARRFAESEESALLLSGRLMSAADTCKGESAYRSAALRIIDDTFFPVVDLRVDNDPDPLKRLKKIYQDYMRDDVKLDAYLPSKDHPTGFAPSSIDETLRWIRRYFFKIRTRFRNNTPSDK